MKYAQIKDSKVENIIEIRNESIKEAFLKGFDFLIEINDSQIINEGYFYNEETNKFSEKDFRESKIEELKYYSKPLLPDTHELWLYAEKVALLDDAKHTEEHNQMIKLLGVSEEDIVNGDPEFHVKLHMKLWELEGK